MISLSSLAQLAHTYREDLDLPVSPLRVGTRVLDLDAQPAVMGCINLSRESTYRDSVATSTESAIRRGRILRAQGADVVDLGAESSTPRAARVDPDDQIAALVPIVRELSDEGVTVSVETHHPDVARACLKAGAGMLNYSGGTPYDEAIFEVVADFGAAIVLCYVPGTDARDIRDAADGADQIPMLLDHFARRLDVAHARGIENIAIDPGIGFSFGPPTTPSARVDRQTRTLLNTFRLRRLGMPVCQALPHAFDLFEDQFRTAEAFFAVLAHLGGCSIYRTHEAARVVRVLSALRSVRATP